MDIRVLQYFLAVAREESITKAAQAMHMTQPPLSRQLKDLEEELGKQLFIRGNRKVTLTEEGRILRKRAEELIELAEKAKAEVRASNHSLSGEIYIGSGETEGFRLIAKAAQCQRKVYPQIHLHLFSGNAEDISDRLDHGLLDFGVLIEPADMSKYDYVRLPVKDRWGLLLRFDHPLAEKEGISPQDLQDLPLIVSRQSLFHNELSGWLGKPFESLNIVATYNLSYNAALLAEENVGCMLCLDHIIPTHEMSPLRFLPLIPKVEAGLALVWKKYQIFSKEAEVFLHFLYREIGLENE